MGLDLPLAQPQCRAHGSQSALHISHPAQFGLEFLELHKSPSAGLFSHNGLGPRLKTMGHQPIVRGEAMTEIFGIGCRCNKVESARRYSITAWSGACACLRKAALLEPIISASGIAHSVNSITIW